MIDSRGVSTVVGYILAISITTALVAALSLSVGGVVDTQKEAVMETQLQIVGEQTATVITEVDRTVTHNDGDVGTIRRELEVPRRVAGEEYSMTVSESGEHYQITVRAVGSQQIVVASAAFDTQTDIDVDGSTVRGGTVIVEYDPVEDELVILND